MGVGDDDDQMRGADVPCLQLRGARLSLRIPEARDDLDRDHARGPAQDDVHRAEVAWQGNDGLELTMECAGDAREEPLDVAQLSLVANGPSHRERADDHLQPHCRGMLRQGEHRDVRGVAQLASRDLRGGYADR